MNQANQGKYLVFGGTGNIGRPLIKVLNASGIETCIYTRDQQKAITILPNSRKISYVEGELTDELKLRSAFKDVNKVVIAVSTFAISKLNLVLQIAKEANIEHMVCVSSVGGETDVRMEWGKIFWEYEQLIKNSNVPYTIIRPHYFMQNFQYINHYLISPITGFSPSREIRGSEFRNIIDTKIILVDVRDISLVISKILMNGSAHIGKTYVLGSEEISLKEIAITMNDILETDFRVRDFTLESHEAFLRENLQLGGKRLEKGDERIDRFINEINGLWEYYAAGREGSTDNVENIGEKSPYSFPDYVSDHSEQLKQMFFGN